MVYCGKAAFFKPPTPAWQRHGVIHFHILGFQQRWTNICSRFEGVAARHAVNELAGVGVLGMRKHLGNTTRLHQVAVLHHRNPIGKFAHQVQVMGNHQNRHAGFTLQVL